MNFLKSNIKHLRILAGLTQARLAEVLGVSRDNVASYERGTTPPVEIIHVIMNYFHVTFNDLLEKDLSQFETKAVEGVKMDKEGENSQMPMKQQEVRKGNFIDRARNIEYLEKVIVAQEITIRTQQETIDALKQVIGAKKIKKTL